MATVAPTSPGAGDLRSIAPVKQVTSAVQPEATSAHEDVISLSPEAVQLIQAASLSGYENQEVTVSSSTSNIPAEEPDGTTLELVG